MKSKFITMIALSAILVLAGCSGMRTVPERDSYAEPKWYTDCVEANSEGLLWWTENYVYACGGGQSRFFQAAEEQMYAIALNQFAKRINGIVNSKTVLEFENNSRSTSTVISYTVSDVAISEYVTHERAKFRYAGEYYTFVRLKMDQEVYNELLEEAKNERAFLNINN